MSLRGSMASAVLVVGLAQAAGCGPIEYVHQVGHKASSEVAAARAVRADQHAPYWYTLAVEYLNKAREEASLSDYQAANRFGRRAAEAARRARQLALRRARDPNAVDADEADPLAAPPVSVDSAPEAPTSAKPSLDDEVPQLPATEEREQP